jgi:Mrp family chromosome partitioning ATPase
VELSDILNSIRRRWRIALGMILITGAVLGAFYVTRQPVEPAPRFRAEVRLLVPTRDEKGELPQGVPPSLLFGQSAIALSDSVRTTAYQNSRIPEDERAGYKFGYSSNETADVITLTISGPDSTKASSLAQDWADAYQGARRDRVANGRSSSKDRSRRAIQVLIDRLNTIETQLRSIDPALLLLRPGVATANSDNSSDSTPAVSNVPINLPIDTALLIYERAALLTKIEQARQSYAQDITGSYTPSSFADVVEVPPVRDITPPTKSPQTPTLLIVAVGLVLALAVPVLIDRMDHTIRDAKTATAAFAAPVLSSIPAAPRTKRYEIAKPGTAREGAYRALAATSVATDRLPRSIVVTSPLGEEQDGVAANFAAALANLGVRVALIGTSPRQAWFADAAPAAPTGNGGNGPRETTTFPQLLELAYSGRLNGTAPNHLLRTSVDNLYVLPPGQADVDVSTDGLAPMLQALANANIDVTVIAAPALLQDPNTTIYAWTTRSVLWVMETGEITVEEAREAASRLALAGVTPLGVAMIDQEP